MLFFDQLDGAVGALSGSLSRVHVSVSLDVEALALGAQSSLPFSFYRASDAGYVDAWGESGPAGYKPSLGASPANQARVALCGTHKILRVSRPITDISQVAGRDSASWVGTAAGGAVTTQNQTAGPDGDPANYADRHNVPANGTGRYPYVTAALPVVSGHYEASVWLKPVGANRAFQSVFYDVQATGTRAVVGTLADGWQQVVVANAAQTNWTLVFFPAEGRAYAADKGGTGATVAMDVYSDMVMVLAGPTPHDWTDTSIAAERAAMSAAGLGPRIGIRFRWFPQLAWSECFPWTCFQGGGNTRGETWAGMPRFVAWEIDEHNKVEINTATGAIVAIVDGVRSPLPVALPQWSRGPTDHFDIEIWCGNGVTTGHYKRNGGSKIDLGIGPTLPPIRVDDDTVIALFSGLDGTRQLDGIANYGGEGGRVQLLSQGAQSNPARTFWASPTGSGLGTEADPASLSTALTLARAQLPARVVLDGGTYYDTAIALTEADSGIEFVNRPQKVPILDGGVKLAGQASWSNQGGGIYRIAFSGWEPEQVTINGAVGAKAELAITPAQWSDLTGGYHGPAVTVAHPERLMLRGAVYWRYFELPVASRVNADTDYLIEATAWTNANTLGSTFAPTAARLLSLVGCSEFLSSSPTGSWAYDGTYLWVKPASVGDLDNVVVAKRQDVIRIEGSGLGSKANNITITGITVRGGHHSYGSHGYVGVQATTHGYIGGSGGGATGDYAVTLLPSALTVRRATAIQLRGVRVTQCAGSGIAISEGCTSGVELHSVESSHHAGSCLTISDVQQSQENPVDSRAKVSNVLVSDCYLHHSGLRYRDGVGLFGGFADHITVQRTQIEECSYDGVMVGWTWTSRPTAQGYWLFDACRIQRCGVTRKVGDGANVYLLGNHTGTIVRNCAILVDLDAGYPGANWQGLYLDNGCTGATITHNVVIAQTATVRPNDPKIMPNNYGIWIYLQSLALPEQATGNTVSNNVYASGMSATGLLAGNTLTNNTSASTVLTGDALTTYLAAGLA